MVGQALLWLSILAAGLPARSVVVSADAPDPLRVVCPVAQVTRIVFPEPIRQLKGPALGSPLNLRVERTKPNGIITVQPSAHPARSSVEFRGASGVIRLLLETAPSGEASELNLVLAEPRAEVEPPSPAPETLPPAPIATLAEAPSPSPAARPTPDPTPAASAPPSSSAVLLDLDGLVRAQAVSIGRREGLPGQRPMVLVDALRGERWIWLRFALEGGAQERIASVSWDQGRIPSFLQEPEGKDLRVILQVPRAAVTRRSRVTLEVESGPIYTFALSSSSLAGFFKDLFQ